MFTFEYLSEPLYKAISDLGYEKPTEIQEKAIPLLLERDTDFVGQAQTGTGKTAAFCLPLLEKLNPNEKGIQAVILSPTRELANQINEECMKFTKYLPYKTACVYGGTEYGKQYRELAKAQIVIATPGRAVDLLKRGKLPINKSEFFIIDEADEMLKMGFIEDVELLMESTSQGQTWMFSATMPAPIVRLMEQKLNSPEMVRVKNKSLSNNNISQSYCRLERKDFIKALRAILLTEEDFYGIVFCETREETKNLSDKLMNLGKRVVSLHGDLNQRQRDIAMEQFRLKKAEVLVCTDVGARGLDVSDVTHVINMGLPRRLDSYVHRIGRTARAGKTGMAISFVAPHEGRNLKQIERMINHKLDSFKLPTAALTKNNKVMVELDKMHGLKQAIEEKGNDFKVDDSYQYFREYMKDMSKEEIMKLMFSYQFKNDLRSIDESLENLKNSLVVPREARRGDRKSRNDRNDRKGRRSYRGNSESEGDGGRSRRGRGKRSKNQSRRSY
jgi:ATP-dependent RNA helicase DeaD